MSRILIADDEVSIRELICDFLENDNHTVFQAKNGQEALELFDKHSNIDLILLDIMMPVVNGIEVLKSIRKHSNVPIIMITAKSEDEDQVVGFKSGCTDYILKPFSMEVLLARITSKLRDVCILGNSYIDKEQRKLFVNGLEVVLTLKEYEILEYFIQNIDVSVSRTDILINIWKQSEDEGRTLDTHIKQLRNKLNLSDLEIETVRGFGFRLKLKDY